MTRLLSSVCFLLLTTVAFGQKGDTLLYKAYKTKSITELQTFFENWALETPSISNENFDKLSDTTKNIYQVFQSFYNPKDISRTSGSEWGNDIYKDVKYFLVQDKIYFAIVDSLVRDSAKFGDIMFSAVSQYDTLNDFRPRLQFPDVKCLSLTKYYNGLLNRYLGDKHYKLGTGSVMSPARSKGESQKRMQFIGNFIKIWYGHWGGYWQLHSYPYASRITFDKDFQNAVVHYRMVYEGGYAYFKKTNGEWNLVKAKLTWIE